MRQAKPSDKDNLTILAFFQSLEEAMAEPDYDIARLVRSRWPDVSASWSRVFYAGRVAIENACDPSLGYLDFKPEIKRAVDAFPIMLAALLAAQPAFRGPGAEHWRQIGEKIDAAIARANT